MRFSGVVLVVWLPIGLSLAAGCRRGKGIGPWCEDSQAIDTPGTQPECCTQEGGQCVPEPPGDFFRDPVLVLIGPSMVSAEFPTCPPEAPEHVFSGYTGLVAPNECGTCQCSPPACILPAGVTTYGTAGECQDQDKVTPVDTPATWDGSCVAASSVSPYPVVEVGFDPPATGCQVVPSSVPKSFSFQWTSLVQVCKRKYYPTCREVGMVCGPQEEPSAGYRVCILGFGATSKICPEDYPEKLLAQQDPFVIEDSRGCTPCTCELTGADCMARVDTYQDPTCGLPLSSFPVSLSGPKCDDLILPGSSLQSLSAQWLTNNPGQCKVGGGEAIGEAHMKDENYLCCRAVP